MKTRLFLTGALLAGVATLISCSRPKPSFTTETLTFEDSSRRDQGLQAGVKFVRMTADDEALAPLAAAFNAAVLNFFAQDLTLTDSTGQIHAITDFNSIKANLAALMEQNLADSLLFSYYGECNQIHTNGQLLSLSMTCSFYFGGAHGMNRCNYKNFDMETGQVLTAGEFLADTARFISLAKQLYEETHAGQPIPSFEELGSNIPLPTNILFTDTGIHLQYNPYEIAPYSEGYIMLDIPYSTLNKYNMLKPEFAAKYLPENAVWTRKSAGQPQENA